MKMIAAFIFFLSAFPSFAETDPKTIQFLEKLNLYDYCLSREGLKNFSCDLKLTLSDSFKEKMGENKMTPKYRKFFNNLRFSLTETSAGRSEVKLMTPMPSGDPVQDDYVSKRAASFQSLVKDIVKTWAESELKPTYDQETYAGGCKVINGTGGFDVEQTSKNGMLTAHYDSQAKVTNVTGQMDGMKVEMKDELTPSPKGYLLTGCSINTDKFSENLKIEHQTIGKFRMPKIITVEMNVPGVLEGTFGLYFSKYQLNQ